MNPGPNAKHVPTAKRFTGIGRSAAAALRLLLFTGCRLRENPAICDGSISISRRPCSRGAQRARAGRLLRGAHLLGLGVRLWRVFGKSVGRHQAVLGLQPTSTVRRTGVADVGDGRSAGARRRQHSPAHHNGAGIAHDRRRIIWKDARHRRQECPSANAAVMRAEAPSRKPQATVALRRTLLVQPRVLVTIAVIRAVHHNGDALDIGLPAGALAAVEDDRTSYVLLQLLVDLPDQLLALLDVRFLRLLVEQLFDVLVAVVRVRKNSSRRTTGRDRRPRCQSG